MKVFEHIVHNQLSIYLNDTKLLYEYSTNQALGVNFPLRRHSLMLQNISSMGSIQEN